MTQSGANTVLNPGAGQSITFDDTTVGSFTASEFNAPFSIAGLTMSFDDEFNSLSLNIGGQSGAWNTTFPNGARSLYSNLEDEAYMDPDFSGTSSQPLGINPFSISNGILTITAQPTNPAQGAYFGNVGDLAYTSGLLTSYGTVAQTYGYWEIRAQVPSGNGLWPAFWLLPKNNAWPPEVDIMEVLGSDPSTVYNSYHSTDGSEFIQPIHLSEDLSAGFHTYGFAWTPSTMTWYVDGSQTAQIATPADMNTPMYMLINLAVGGNFPGWPDATTQFPANYRIDYVHVYGLGTSTPAPSGLTLDPSTDSGVSGDDITNITRPKINGQGVAGNTVTLYDGVTAVGTGVVGSGDNWQIVTPVLSYGAHSLTASQTDSAGNTSPSSAPLSLDIVKRSVPDDLYGNGLSDLVFQDASTGQIQDWELSGTSILSAGTIGTPSNATWQLAGIGDLNGDGHADLILQNTSTGQIQGWEMNGTSVVSSGTIGTPANAAWHLAGVGDLNGDGRDDMILQNASTGQVQGWEMNGTSVLASGVIGTPSDPSWKLAGVRDLNGDGYSDLIFQNTGNGQVSGGNLGSPSDPGWKLKGIDYPNSDGHAELVFQNAGSGQVWGWEANGTSIIGGDSIGIPGSAWNLLVG